MEVSVIIVNYNTFEITCNCIQSILDKTRGISFQIILVDNGSTDRNASEFKKKYPEIILIINDINLGFSKAVNLGIRNSEGEIILLINSDCVLENNAIKICHDYLKNHRDIGIVTGKLVSADMIAQHNCQRFPSVSLKLFELFRLQKILPASLSGKILLGPYFNYRESANPEWIWGTFFMFRSGLLKLMPGHMLSDRFFLYGEDMEWCLEFRKQNIRIAFEPTAVIFHHSGKSGADKQRFITSNTNQLLDDHYSRVHRFLIKLANFMLTGSFSYY